MSKPTLFIVDSSSENRSQLDSILSPFYDLIFSDSSTEALSTFLKNQMKIRVILIHLNPNQEKWIDLIRSIKSESPFPEILGYSSEENIQLAVAVMKEGAFSYFSHPFSRVSVLRLLEEALTQINIRERVEVYHNQGKFDQDDKALIKMVEDHYKGDLLTGKKGEKSKVLIVEDEPIYRKAITSFLDQDHHVLVAETKTEALALIHAHADIRIVLLDVFLPDGSGMDVLAEIQKMNKGIQVVMVTAFEFVDIAVDSIRKGACEYLNKPFLKEDLLNAVQKAQNRYYKFELLPKAVQAFIQDPHSYPHKIAWVNTLYENRKKAKTSVHMEDLYKVFPDLKETYIPGSVPLPAQVLENKGLEGFIQELHKNSILGAS